MAGDWTAGDGTDLADLLTPFAGAAHRPGAAAATAAAARRGRAPAGAPGEHPGGRAEEHQARTTTCRNDLFAAFLDPTHDLLRRRWFEPGDALAERLEAAQLRKIDGILDPAGVGAGTRVLEIGTGWGALAIRAAERGAPSPR